MEDELRDLGVAHAVELGLGREPALARLAADRGEVEPAAVVGDLDRDRAALVVGGEADRALLGLAGGAALERALDAVIRRVADHVGQRILDQLEHLAVELGLGALHDELDLLAELRREVAHDPRQLLPGGADRLHARLHDAFLQLGGDVREALQRHLVAAVVLAPGDLEELVARQHQLRDHGHEVLERVDVDADRLHLRRRRGVGRLGLEWRGRRGGWRGGALRRRARGGAEGAFEIVERGLARLQRPLLDLVDEGSGGDLRLGRGFGRTRRGGERLEAAR